MATKSSRNVSICTDLSICTHLKKIQDATKKLQWFQKTFWGEEDELEKGQKKFYQLLRTRFRKIQDLPKGFEKTIFKLFF